MQCSNCQFENMPGVRACGRCGASLQLATMAVDVYPPRASPTAKAWRRRFPWHRYWRRLRETLSAVAARVTPAWPVELPPLAVALRLIVPGWAQKHLGRMVWSRRFLTAYLALLLSGLLFLGTALGSILLGLAVAVHAASVLDVVLDRVYEPRRRVLDSLLCLAALTFLVYVPAGWLITRVAVPQQIIEAVPPFRQGDVILYNPSAFRHSPPQPGDVVLYRGPVVALTERGPQGNIAYRLEGDRIDRVIARDGQSVTWKDRELRVDGQPSPWLPLNADRLPESLSLRVPQNCCLILPTTDPMSGQFTPGVWAHVSIVPDGNVWGRVFFRTQPLWRISRIR